MDTTTLTLAALLGGSPLQVWICDPAPCRLVEVRADGDRVSIVGDATAEQVLSVVLKSMLATQKAQAERLDTVTTKLKILGSDAR